LKPVAPCMVTISGERRSLWRDKNCFRGVGEFVRPD